MAYTTIDKPTDYFNTVLWTGTGVTDRTVTGVGFQPDWTWIKERSAASGHVVFDVIRGATKRLFPDAPNAEDTITESLKSFDTDGFTLGTNGQVNENTQTYVGWNWLADNTSGSSNTDGSTTSTVSANTTSGFSIVTYTGTGGNTSVGHGLGVAPDCMIIKCRSHSGTGWWMYHKDLGATKSIYLHDSQTSFTNSYLQNTAPTSSVFTLDSTSDTNASGRTIVAYCFANKKGFSRAFSYTGNGSSDGTFVYLGFKPAWILLRRTDGADYWTIRDNKRDVDNVVTQLLYPNVPDAEATAASNNYLDIVSNGFKLRATSGQVNASGGSYIGLAFAENPFVTSTGIPCTAR